MLKISTDDAGRLTIRALGEVSTAMVTFLPEGIRLSTDDGAAAVLTWVAYHMPNVGSPGRRPSGWTFDHCYDLSWTGPLVTCWDGSVLRSGRGVQPIPRAAQ